MLGPISEFKVYTSLDLYIQTRLIPNWSERLSECEGRVVKQNGKEMKEELTLLVSICSQFWKGTILTVVLLWKRRGRQKKEKGYGEGKSKKYSWRFR